MFARLLLCILCLGTASVVLAQDMQMKYVVQPGDTLWDLAGAKLDDPRVWGKIVEQNAFLQEPGRVFKSGSKTVVLVRPGEELVGLEKIGILPTIEPLDSLTRNVPVEPKVVIQGKFPDWLGWLLLAIGIAIMAWVLVRWMLNSDAATAGPSVVPGGVTEQTAQARFQDTAARLHHIQTGVAVPAQQFSILEQKAGRIWGVLNVRYANGREVPRRLNGERAFRARVRFPNGTEETLYMLAACGNDLRYGGISRYLPGPDFRFEEDVATPTAQPAPVATPVPAAQAITAPVASDALAHKTEAGDGKVTFEYKPSSGDQPHLVRLKGIDVVDFNFESGPDGLTVRYREAVPASKVE